MDEALLYAGRKTAVESSIVDSDEALLLSAKAYVLSTLKDDSLIEKHVEHGVWGITLWGSEIAEEDIVLRADYVVKLPISYFGIRQVELSSQNCFRKWTGDRWIDAAENFVYVTPKGEVYHMSLSCRSLNLSVKGASVDEITYLRGKNGQKYYECTRCDWKDNNRERVYYTDYGTLFHKDIACSAIKRTIEKIDKSDIGERRPCSFCYGL